MGEEAEPTEVHIAESPSTETLQQAVPITHAQILIKGNLIS